MVVSAISHKKVIHNKIFEGSRNGEIFLEFIKELKNKFNNDNVMFLLLDNARVHRYGELLKYINRVKKFELIYNVLYSSQSNPIERVFKDKIS